MDTEVDRAVPDLVPVRDVEVCLLRVADSGSEPLKDALIYLYRQPETPARGGKRFT